MTTELIHDQSPEPTEVIMSGFNYDSVPELADELRQTANRIRERWGTSIIETGRDLIAMKSHLGHGKFFAWIEVEFVFSRRTAENMMAAARWASDKCANVAHLAATALYTLAEPSTPQEVQEKVLALLEAGEISTPHAVKQMIRDARAACATNSDAKEPRPPGSNSPKQATRLDQRSETNNPSPVELDRVAQPELEQLKSLESGEFSSLEAEQREAKSRQTAQCISSPSKRQEPTEFTWEAGAPQLIDFLVTAVIELNEIPNEKAIKGLLNYCGLRHLAERLSDRSSKPIEIAHTFH